MATISYKCDTCKRNIELVENPQGFTVFGKCVITNGCRGKLYKTERNPNNVRESAPTFTGGVDNYVPRRAFNEFTQGLMSDRWKVSHGLGTTPATFVYELTDDGQTVPIDNSYYTVQEVDKNNIVLIFPRKLRGIVQSVARSTVPLIPSTLPEDEIVLQASSKGIITFAIPKYLTQIVGNIPDVSPPAITPTLTPSPTPTSTPVNLPLGLCTVDDIQIEIEIIRPNEEPIVCFERIPYQVDNKSPWTGWNEVLIRKRRNYCIRTVNILSLKIFGNANLKATDIPNGTRIRFLRIDYGTGRTVEIPSRGLLMLLSQNPHEYVDKIKDRLIDVGELIGDVPNYFVYNDGELFLDESKVEKTYPDISRVITRAPTIPAFSPTPTPSVTASATPPATPEASYTPTPTSSGVPQPTSGTQSPTPTPTPVPSGTMLPTVTPTVTATASPTPTVTPTVTPSSILAEPLRFTAGSGQLYISGFPLGSIINWGDGSANEVITNLSASHIHTYSAGTHHGTVAISDNLGSATHAYIGFTALRSIQDWGTSIYPERLRLTNSSALTTVPNNIPSSITNIEIMFSGCTVMNSDLSQWNVSNVTNMVGMFGNAMALNTDLSSWCVENISSEPVNFRSNAPNIIPPVWGTCP